MSDAHSSGSPRLRVVRSDEAPPPERRPGPAVFAVVVYAVVFAIALWYLRARVSRAQAPGAPAPAGGAPSSASGPSGSRDRAFLLSGAGLAGAARSRFDRRLSVEHCDCGCSLTLHDCLSRDQSCSRSPERAGAVADELR